MPATGPAGLAETYIIHIYTSILDILEVIFDCSLVERVHNVQQLPFGGLKVEEKRVRKSVGWVVCCLEAKSDIML